MYKSTDYSLFSPLSLPPKMGSLRSLEWLEVKGHGSGFVGDEVRKAKGHWYQVSIMLLFHRGDMETFWTGDFHHQMFILGSKIWPKVFN